jgi:hypothetical protein
MNKRQNVFCALVICIIIVCLAGNAIGRQKSRRRNNPSVPEQTNVLSRGRAADLIKAYQGFKFTYSRKIPVGRFWYHKLSDTDVEKDLLALEAQEILTLKATGQSIYNGVTREYVVELTSKGEAEAKAWVKTSETTKGEFEIGPESPDVTVFRIKIAERQLVEVTGIAFDSGGKSARAEFTWRWSPTAQAKLLPKTVPSDKPQAQAFYFRLYDDGWRVVGQAGIPLNEITPLD